MACYEGYVDGAVYTRNLGQLYRLTAQRYAVMLVPKLETPICDSEIAELDTYDLPYPIFIGSTDSPETAERYLGEHEIGLPFIHVTPTGRFRRYIDRDGYCRRMTVYMENGKVIGEYEVGLDDRRDIHKMLYDFV